MSAALAAVAARLERLHRDGTTLGQAMAAIEASRNQIAAADSCEATIEAIEKHCAVMLFWSDTLRQLAAVMWPAPEGKQ